MRKSLFTLLGLAFLCPAGLSAQKPGFAPNQLLVRFRSASALPDGGVTSAGFSALSLDMAASLQSINAVSVRPLLSRDSVKGLGAMSAAGAKYAHALDQQSRTLLVQLKPETDVPAAVERLKRGGNVEMCEPNYRMEALTSPNDTQYGTQWALKNTGQSGGVDQYDPASGTVGADVDAEIAWTTQTGSKNVIAAVIDTGINYTHGDLSANIYSNSTESAGTSAVDDDHNGYIDDVRGWDFGDGDNSPDDDCTTTSAGRGHGTHVAGILGAVGNNAAGVTGMNWNVTLMPLKAADSTCTMLVSNVAEAVAYAAANGAKVINMSLGGEDSATMKSAVELAMAAGVAVVAAAGNDGNTTKVYPAAYDNVISVAATDRTDRVASFSTYGSWVILSAPGEAVRSTLPVVDGSYGYKSGTSMSCPLVAGIAALVLAQYPSLTLSQLTSRLTSSCENIDALNPSYVGLMGAGRINAARALLSVSAVAPDVGAENTSVDLTVTGVGFMSGLGIQLRRSGQTSITASNVVINSSTSLTCRVNLAGAATGYWDVAAVIGQTVQSLSASFTVESLLLSSIAPARVTASDGPFSMTLTGRNFSNGITAALHLNGESAVAGTGVTVNSPTSATVTFDPTGIKGGRWDVVVASGSESSTLSAALAVLASNFSVVDTNPGADATYAVANGHGSASVLWPAAVTSDSVELEVNGSPSLPAVNAALDPYVATGSGVEITASPSSALARSFDIVLPYQLADLTDSSKESVLTIGTYNSSTGRWEPLPSQVDTSAHTVSAHPTHLSFYAILQHTPASGLGKITVFPNPFRTDRGHSRIVFDFLPAGSRVRLFDLAGQMVRDLQDDDGDGQILWPVTNDAGDPVASGIYVYLITDSAGSEKKGRLGVLR